MVDASGPASQGRVPDVADALLVGAALLACAALLAELLAFPWGSDHANYAMVGETLLRGGMPYRDAWDFKPPGIFYLFAAAQGVLGPDMQAIRWLEAAAFASLIGAFAIFSRRHVGSARAGLLGAALALLSCVQLGHWHTAQPESFGAVAIAWALVLASYETGRARRQRLAWLGAGALYGFAGLLKPPLGAGLAVSLGFVLWQRRRAAEWRQHLVPAACLLGGAALVGVAALLHFAVAGALGDLGWTLFGWVPHYTALGFRPEALPGLLLRSAVELLFRWSWLPAAGLACLALLPSLGPRQNAALVHVFGVLGMTLLGVAVQAKFIHYHYASSMALLSLPAGWGLWKLRGVAREAAVGVAAVACLVAVLPWLPRPGAYPVEGLGSIEWTRERARLFYQSRRPVAAWLTENTPPDSALFVWGVDPILYKLSGRRPASRYIHDLPLRASWSRDVTRPLLMQDLANTPPAAIVVDAGDRHPLVLGERASSAEALEEFPELRELLDERYREAATFGRFRAHLRRP